MVRRFQRNSLRTETRGIAALELAVVVPLFVFLFWGLIDLGRALNQYLILTHIAYEGVRLASSVAGLEPNDEWYGQKSLPAGHTEVQTDIRRLLERTGLGPGDYVLETFYVEPDGSTTQWNTAENSVKVSIRANFEALFPVFRGLKIQVAASSPYLFRDDAPDDETCET